MAENGELEQMLPKSDDLNTRYRNNRKIHFSFLLMLFTVVQMINNQSVILINIPIHFYKIYRIYLFGNLSSLKEVIVFGILLNEFIQSHFSIFAWLFVSFDHHLVITYVSFRWRFS